MELGMAGVVVVIMFCVFAATHGLTAPARSAELAMRDLTGQPDLTLETPLIRYYTPTDNSPRFNLRLVCSRPGTTPVFAAVVEEGSRDRSSSRDLVRALQTPTQRRPAAGEDLLQACAAIKD